MTKPKLIVPQHIWDGKAVEKQKKEMEKVPNPTGYRITLFPLKLDSKTKSVIHLIDETVQESQLTTSIGEVYKLRRVVERIEKQIDKALKIIENDTSRVQ